MRHRQVGKKFGRVRGSRVAMLRSLLTSVVLYEKITTTETKAKAVKPLVERAITTAKKGDLASRRRLAAVVSTPGAVKKLLEELGPRYASRPGGYTRIIKLGVRQGDGSPMVLLEFV